MKKQRLEIRQLQLINIKAKKPVHNNNEKEEHVEIEKFAAEKEANFSLSIRIRPERQK